ncbi:MAG: hypothetical protein IJ375_02440 [Oscillospiraceae bacterium]|nr:hypothetical protein [Oscillospiraceae bacterium]
MRKKGHIYIALFFGFLLGIQNGFITLWSDGSPEPVEVFPYRAELLPEADQRALEKGIRAESSENLAKLLEDYLS